MIFGVDPFSWISCSWPVVYDQLEESCCSKRLFSFVTDYFRPCPYSLPPTGWCTKTLRGSSHNFLTHLDNGVLRAHAVSVRVLETSTGSEVAICVRVAKALGAKGTRARVVSMPCWELFEPQDEAYQLEGNPVGSS